MLGNKRGKGGVIGGEKRGGLPFEMKIFLSPLWRRKELLFQGKRERVFKKKIPLLSCERKRDKVFNKRKEKRERRGGERRALER